MAISTARSKRKVTGGKYRAYRKKRLHELGRTMIEVNIGQRKIKRVKGRGSKTKILALSLKDANIFNPKTRTFQKAEIVQVKENPANPHFVRRNVITKGTIIETKIGLAKVINRPGQEGTVNAILIEKK